MAEQASPFASTLRRLRLAAGQSVRDLENNSGVSRSVISRLESGEYARPQPETLRRLAQALRADVAELLTAAGYTADQAEALPNLTTYLRSKYGHLPPSARQDLADYLAKLEQEYGSKQQASPKNNASSPKKPQQAPLQQTERRSK